jgi:hypothetical protein
MAIGSASSSAGLVAVSLNEASGPYLLDFQDTIRVDTRKQAILAFFGGITAEKLSAQGQIHRQGSGETIHGRNHGRIGSTEVTANQAAPHDADDFTRHADRRRERTNSSGRVLISVGTWSRGAIAPCARAGKGR